MHPRGRLFQRLKISATMSYKTSSDGYLYLFFSASTALHKVNFVCLTRLLWASRNEGPLMVGISIHLQSNSVSLVLHASKSLLNHIKWICKFDVLCSFTKYIY